MYNYLVSAILGAVEGLTEFLPVSSTGHLIAIGEVLDFHAPPGRTFEVMIQLGAILALTVFYGRTLLRYGLTFHTSHTSRSVVFGLILAMLPAIVFGVLFHKHIKETLYSTQIVALSLIFGGFVLLWVDKFMTKPLITTVENVPVKTAFLIGLAQSVALIPGVSRSGATIVGGMLCKLDKKTAAEFSFLLSIPIMSAAFFYDAYKNWDKLDWTDIHIILIGFITAFFSALLVVKPFLAIISRIGFAPFAYYRIIFGIFLLYWIHSV